MTVTAITTDPATLLASAYWSFSTRRVQRADACRLHHNYTTVSPGDLVLARVLKLGQHCGIQLPEGRRAALSPGDLIVMPCGARYAPDQFEGVAEIDPGGADMLAGGGCLGRARARHDRMRPATRVLPLGCLVNAEGNPVNVSDYALPPAAAPATLPLIAVVGTAMNSGKTLATARLAMGLRQAGLRVAALKGTGTGSFGDYHSYVDSGAHYVADFTDAGMATTYMMPISKVREGIDRLLCASEAAGCDVAVMELADGLLQRETAALLADPGLRDRMSGMVFACGDAVAAVGGVAELRRLGHEPDALTGLVSCSPMACEEARAATGIRVVGKAALADPAEALTILRQSPTDRAVRGG
jgi:hypothetical protein